MGILDYDFKGIMTEYLTNRDSTDNTQFDLFHPYVCVCREVLETDFFQHSLYY